MDQSSSLLLLGDEESSLQERLRVKKGEDFDPIPVQLLRKYVGYARKYVQPRIGDEAAQALQVHVCFLCKVNGFFFPLPEQYFLYSHILPFRYTSTCMMTHVCVCVSS